MPELRDRLQAVLGDAYRVERELGGGGMSRVFLVADRSLGRDIIVKVLSPELAEGVSLERFSREIRTIAQLQHPHIVPVLSAGRIGDLPYYAMPYVGGDSLRSLLKRHPLPIAEVVGILRDVAKALEFAHERGVVHRDIKPDNVLLSGNSAVVSDFGIAKAVSAARSPAGIATLTQVGTSIGTPAYMSPEQALAAPDVDHRADIYAFGVMAYELLSGVLPFEAGRPQEMIKAHITRMPAELGLKRPDVPAHLGRLIMQCLEKEPARRPVSARALLNALEEHSGAHAIAGRSRRVALVAGVVALVLSAGALGVWASKARGEGLGPAVAVLPFENLSGDTASEYFSDGMTEQLVGTLSRANGLRVASRSATFAQKGKKLHPRDAAQAFHVDYLLSGSVRKSGDQLRVTAELVDRDGNARWSQTFDRRPEDVFAVQEEIARSITSSLKVSLAPTPKAGRATDAITYDLFLRGEHVIRALGGTQRGRSRLMLDTAIDLFERSIARDSAFAPAWSALSNAYRQKAEYVAPLTVLPRAKEAARRAVDLDPSDLSAGIALANITLNFDWNWEAAEREYRRVIALHPEEPSTLIAYAVFLRASRRYEEALALYQRAHELQWRKATDTTRLRARQMRNLAMMQTSLGRPAEAERLFREAIRIAPDAADNHWLAGWSLMRSNPAMAVKELEITRQLIGDLLPQLSHLGVAYGLAGRPDSTRRIIAELLRRSRTEYIPKDQLYVLYYSIGERKEAFRWLALAIEEHHWWLPYLNGGTEAFRGDDPEYRRLMRKIGTPESALVRIIQ